MTRSSSVPNLSQKFEIINTRPRFQPIVRQRARNGPSRHLLSPPTPLFAATLRYKDATYELPGPASTEKGAESVKQTAAKIIAYFQANNYKIKEAGETIT